MCTHGPDVTLRNLAVRRREETCCSRHACVRTLTAPSSSLTVCRMLCCSSSSMSSRCSCACDSLPSSEAAAASCRGDGQHQRGADDRACPGTHERWRQHPPRAPRAAERGRVGATACVQRLVDKRRSPGLRNDYSITLALFQTMPPAPNTRQRCCPFDPLPHAPIPASRPTSFLAHGADPRGVVPVTTPGT